MLTNLWQSFLDVPEMINVGKMLVYVYCSEYSEKVEDLAEFAECVRSTRWKYGGHCQDDVVIVMATNVTTTKVPMVSAGDVNHFPL